jgi:hypothetical protein
MYICMHAYIYIYIYVYMYIIYELSAASVPPYMLPASRRHIYSIRQHMSAYASIRQHTLSRTISRYQQVGGIYIHIYIILYIYNIDTSTFSVPVVKKRGYVCICASVCMHVCFIYIHIYIDIYIYVWIYMYIYEYVYIYIYIHTYIYI